jgi:Protein of unknown function, DUF481
VTRTLLAGLCAVLVAAPALAQGTKVGPTFAETEMLNGDDDEDTGWKAEAKAGLLWLAGNSDSTSLSAGLTVTRDAVWQRYSLAANYAFAKARAYASPPTPVQIRNIDELRGEATLSARLWNVTPRFDQWLVHRKAAGDLSVYLLGNIASDYAAGKKLFGGGQIGVSTLGLKSGPHGLITELGYDYTYLQPYVGDGYSIHSLRIAATYLLDLSKATKFSAGVEYLVNLNKEVGAPDPVDPTGVPAFEDHRVNALVTLTTQVYNRLSLNLSWTGKYDAKPNFVNLPANVSPLPPAEGVFLRKFDSVTQVQFVYTFG